MSEAQAQAQIIAILCVIESSLTLATEWPQVQAEYLVPLLHRLGELHSTTHVRLHLPRILHYLTALQFRLAFVSYGTADTMPTPVLSKIFFSNPTPMMNQMREEPHKLGIGRTGSGDGYGMAALEGMVAALEVCPSHLYRRPRYQRDHIV